MRVIMVNKLKSALRTQNKNIRQLPCDANFNYVDKLKFVKQIKQKLEDNNAIATKADKYNTIGIMKYDICKQKTYDFISSNNLKAIDKAPNKKYVKELNKCTHLLSENTRRKLKPINSQAPKVTGLPKTYKEGTPIRPLIN